MKIWLIIDKSGKTVYTAVKFLLAKIQTKGGFSLVISDEKIKIVLLKKNKFFWGTLVFMLFLTAMFVALLQSESLSSVWIFAFICLFVTVGYVIEGIRHYRGFIKLTKPRYIDKGRHEGLGEIYDAFARTVKRAELKRMPRLCVLSMDGMCAYAFKSLFSSTHSIGISIDMLMKLGLSDIEAIIGHEVAHLKTDESMVARCVLPVMCRTFFWFGSVWVLTMGTEPSLIEHAVALFALLLTLVSSMLDAASSRQSELACDAYSAWLTQSDSIAVALARSSPRDEKKTGLAALAGTITEEVLKLDSHPTLQERQNFLRELDA